MRALIDHNLSRSLRTAVGSIKGITEVVHVSDVGLEQAPDSRVWMWCTLRPTMIWTKDRDFANLAMRVAALPKVVWVNVGNLPTSHVWALIELKRSSVERFVAAPDETLLLLENNL